MKKWMLLAILPLSFGCSDDPIDELSGEYELQRVEDAALPFTIDAAGAEGCWWRLVDGSLTVGDEDQFMLRFTEQVGCGSSEGETAPGLFVGHVQRTGPGFLFVAERLDGNLEFPAVMTGGVLEIAAAQFNLWAPGPFVLEFE